MKLAPVAKQQPKLFYCLQAHKTRRAEMGRNCMETAGNNSKNLETHLLKSLMQSQRPAY